MPILSLVRVSKSFRALKVTDNVSLSVEVGDVLGIIGPNAAGKSTLFNLVTGKTSDPMPGASRCLTASSPASGRLGG